MSATAATDAPKEAKKGGKKKLMIIVLGALIALGAGGWFSGIIRACCTGKIKSMRQPPRAKAMKLP